VTPAKRANTSFTYLGSYADSRMACQLIEWQLPRGFENMKLSAVDAWMEGFSYLFKHLETSSLSSPPVSRRSWPCVTPGPRLNSQQHWYALDLAFVQQHVPRLLCPRGCTHNPFS
jgi:hypothetical protein